MNLWLHKRWSDLISLWACQIHSHGQLFTFLTLFRKIHKPYYLTPVFLWFLCSLNLTVGVFSLDIVIYDLNLRFGFQFLLAPRILDPTFVIFFHFCFFLSCNSNSWHPPQVPPTHLLNWDWNCRGNVNSAWKASFLVSRYDLLLGGGSSHKNQNLLIQKALCKNYLFVQVFLPSGQEQPVILVAIILLEKTFMIHTRSLSVLHSILICSFTLPIDTFACTAFLVRGLLEGAEVTLYLSSILVSFHCWKSSAHQSR